MKKHLFAQSLAAIALSLAMAPSSKAQLIAYDGLDTALANGGNVGNTAGGATSTGWNGNWKNAVTTYTNVGLAYSDSLGNTLTTSGGSAYSAGTSPQRTISTGINPTASGTFWISVLLREIGPTDAGHGAGGPTYTRQADLGLFPTGTTNGGGGNERLDVGRASFNTYAGMPYDTFTTWNANGIAGFQNPIGTPLVPAANYALGQTTFVLLELVLGGSTNADNAYIWFNPNLDIAPTTGSADITDLGNVDLNGASGNLALRFQSSTASGVLTNSALQFDEIRVGNAFADVTPFTAPVPEPTTMALAGLGGLALLALSRKRS